MSRSEIQWSIVKEFVSGAACVEVSASSTSPPRYSYRVSWRNDNKQGMWFPDRGISFADAIGEAVLAAEAWILDERDRALKAYEDQLAQRREKEADKRKRHNDNVQRRRDENRESTRRAKSNGR